MKIVSVYYAYDDTEFYDEDECREYEQYAVDMMKELFECYEFYTENAKIDVNVSEDIEELLDLWETVYSDCNYIKVIKTPGESAIVFLDNVEGIKNLPDSIGWYRYDIESEGWTEVAE